VLIVTEKYTKKKEITRGCRSSGLIRRTVNPFTWVRIPSAPQKLNKMKTTEADMQRLYDYMDKMGVKYTVDRNPSPEKIAEIKAKIERSRSLLEKSHPS
jgi:hypothetical protein